MGDLLVGPADGPPTAGPAAGPLGHGEGHGGEDRPGPGPEVLGGELAAGELLHEVVDVGGVQVDPPAVRAEGEQHRPARPPALQRRHHREDVLVDDRLHPALARLGRVVEGDGVPGPEGDVLPAQGGQPVGPVLLHVLLAADAEEPEVEQADGAGQDPLPGRLVAGQQRRAPATHLR